MKVYVALFLPLLISCSCEQRTSGHHSISTAAKVLQVTNLEDLWMQALQHHDTVALANLLATRFVQSGQGENVETRAHYLQTAGKAERTLEPIVLIDRHFEVFDNTVISTGKAIYKGQWNGNTYDLEVRYTNTYVKLGKEWKAVAAHYNMID